MAASPPPSLRPSPWGWAIPALLIVAISIAHYTASASAHIPHDIFRRLYYLPIILAAFTYGLRGGVAAAVTTTLCYLPHALGHISHDPAAPVDKGLELLLYNVVGVVTGLLVERERREKREHEETAATLRATLEERHALEGELRRRERLATVGELTAALAHEIRNPLGSLKGAAQILADPALPPEEHGRLLAILGEEACRLDRVLTDFLTLARDRKVRHTTVDIAACVRETASLLGPEAEAQQVHVQVVGEAGPVEVEGDGDLLRQLLWNLARNGVEAAGEGGEVVLRVEGRESERVRLVVEDTGPGIADEDLPRLFDPFFTTRDGGTGLGLAICDRIARDHGATLTAENRPQGGARFTVELPGRDMPPRGHGDAWTEG